MQLIEIICQAITCFSSRYLPLSKAYGFITSETKSVGTRPGRKAKARRWEYSRDNDQNIYFVVKEENTEIE